ncbi:MAG: hypothetical protein JSU91_06915, partial [Thermoplasmatales archaeon]
MKAKIFCIFIMMLLISTTMCSLAVNVENDGYKSRGWSEKQKFLASDGSGGDRFGCSTEINDNDAIIGAYFDDISGQTNAGSAYVFTYGGAAWTQQAKLTASDFEANDEFGYSVSIEGDTAVVGSPKEDSSGSDSGAAYVFVRSGSSWSQQQKLLASDGAGGDQFGKSVSVDGDYVIVGAPGKSSDQGFSYIFKRTGSVWTQMTKIGATGSNKLGWSVSISMPFVIMGAYGTNNNIGSAHIYELVESSWYGKGALTASDGITADLFGISVAIDEDYVICGSPGHDLTSGGEGAAYIFEKPTSGWVTMTETQKIIASDSSSGDGFGASVYVNGDHIIVSSPDDDDKGTASGSAYVFNRGTSTWSESVKFVASDGATQDYFGWSVSISSVFAIVGAYAEDNTNGADAGSAYLFEWVNQAPSAPVITGPTSGKTGTSYPFTFTSTDPDGDQVSYYVDWGDSTNTGWFGPYASGATQTKSNTWSSQGNFTIQAKAKDVHGAESGWSSHIVNIPRTRSEYNLLLL